MTIAGRKVWTVTEIIERTAIIPCSVSPLREFVWQGCLKITFSIGRRCTWADEGCEKVFFPDPHPPSATVPPLPEGEGYFLDDGFCDFAFGSAQNDRVVWVVGKRISFRTRETNKKSLMLCALLLCWCSVDCFLVDAMCLGFWLMLCKLVLIDSCFW